MPINYKLYPPNWKTEIRPSILERANNCCEHCGVANYSIGARGADGKWYSVDEIDNMKSDIGYSLWWGGYPKLIKIVLTIAHLGVDYPDGRKGDKTNKMDVRPENLQALCQKCHLNLDIDEHAENRKKTYAKRRDEKIVDLGQLKLFSEKD